MSLQLSRLVGQLASWPVCLSVSRSVGQSVSRSVGQSVSRSVNLSVCLSVSQSVSSIESLVKAEAFKDTMPLTGGLPVVLGD